MAITETTKFLIENIQKSYEIYAAITRMDDEIFTKIDNEIRRSIKDWCGSDWITPNFESLQKDWAINFLHPDWVINSGDKKERSLIWPYMGIGGDNPIWKFFGVNDENNENEVCFSVTFDDLLKQFPNYKAILNEFDERNSERLTTSGFIKTNRFSDRYYKNIFFDSTAVLKGFIEEDWEDALKPIKSILDVLKELDVDFLKSYTEKCRNT